MHNPSGISHSFHFNQSCSVPVQSPLSVVASLNGTLGCHLPGDALCNEQFMDHVCAITSGDMSVVADHSLG